MAKLTIPKLPPLKVGSRVNKGVSYFYVQTFTHHYDKEKKRSVRDSQKTVGTILNNQKYGRIQWKEDFVKEYPELEHFVVDKTEKGFKFTPVDEDLYTAARPDQIIKMLGGASWAFNQALAQTGIGDVLRDVFPTYKRYLKIASLACYMFLTRECAMDRYEPFAKIHWLAWPKPLNGSQVHKLLKSISADDIKRFFQGMLKHFMKANAKNLNQKVYLALDSTSISTHASLAHAEYGHNKDGDTLRQINFLMICDQQTGAPIYAKTYKGNVVDVQTLKRTLADLSILLESEKEDRKSNLVLVTDRGYDSSDNLEHFMRQGYGFIMRSRMTAKWIKDLVDESLEELVDDNYFDAYTKQYAYTKEIQYYYDPFPVAKKRKRNNESKPLYVHILYDEEIQQSIRSRLRENVVNARNDYNEAVKAYYAQTKSPKAEHVLQIDIGDRQGFINNYCTLDALGYAKIDRTNLDQKVRFSGVMVLLSDCIDNAQEAYFAYVQRQCVERNFKIFKLHLNFRRQLVSSDAVLEGKILCEYIATAVSILFDYRLRKYEMSPYAKEDGFKMRLYSQARLIDELNTIMLTHFKGGYYFDEILGKYRHFYKALGIPLPEAKHKYTANINVTDEVEEDSYEEINPEFVSLEGEEL